MDEHHATTEDKNEELDILARICPRCHQSVLPEYYFCPNCGQALIAVPLSTSTSSALGLYAFSIILPSLCFLFIGKWKGLAYLHSKDPKARTVGVIASSLLIVSTVLTFWYAYAVTQKILQSSLGTISQDMEGY